MGAFDDLVPGGNVTVSEGSKGMGTNEAKTREAQFSSQPQLRQVGRDLATAMYFNDRIPTGRFAARVSEAGQQFPTGWQPQHIADYQSFMGLRQGMAKPLISLMAPAGTTTSSKEMDTPKELELALNSIPGPDKEKGANTFLIDRAGRAALDKMAFNAFTDRWRSRFGSVYAKDKSGRTATSAFDDYKKTPDYQRTVLTPFSQQVQQRVRAKRQQAGQPQTRGFKFLGFE